MSAHPAAAALSDAKRALREARLRGLVVPADTIPRLAPGEDAPLSFAQERLWFLDRLQPGLSFHNMPEALRLPGPVDAEALERALGEVLRRHEVLRATIREVDGVATQVVAPFAGFALPVDDLSALPADAREAEMLRRVCEEGARPFDLGTGPLFRARLLRLADDDHVLVVCAHHIVTDGWSMGVLRRELAALYAAFRDGLPSPLPEPPIQYGDWAAWQRTRLRGPALAGHMAYWMERLAGAPERIELPTDHPHSPMQRFRGGYARALFPVELTARLEALARGEGATLFMVLLAAFQTLLCRCGGGTDVLVGTPTAGRTRRELEGLVGCFVNTLVMRTDLSGDPSFREALRRVREVTLGAHEHADAPFEALVAGLRLERNLAHPPLVQVMLVMQEGPAAAGAGVPAGPQPVPLEVDDARYDLMLTVTSAGRGLAAGLQYRADLFRHETAVRLLARLGRLLTGAAADPDARLSALPLLDEDERAALRAWSGARSSSSSRG
ncbi:MAG TPA: condensation domain-containing protein, partial [Longimicrobium sp.]|nr:condensation domain-containing protein [Longimicrobium sp.]